MRPALLTPTLSVGVGRMFEVVCLCFCVCLFVCLFVCLSVCPEHNSKTKHPKVFKLGVGNDLDISEKWHGFGTERSKVKVRVKQYGVGSSSECHLVNSAFEQSGCHTALVTRERRMNAWYKDHYNVIIGTLPLTAYVLLTVIPWLFERLLDYKFTEVISAKKLAAKVSTCFCVKGITTLFNLECYTPAAKASVPTIIGQ